MKTIYCCEKCGKPFSDYGDCMVHENAHEDLALLWSFDFVDEDREGLVLAEYDQTTLAPKLIYCKMPTTNLEDGAFIRDAHGNVVYEVVPYVRSTENVRVNAHAEKLAKALLRWSAQNPKEV